MDRVRPTLAYGAHYGRSQLRRDVPGFTLSILQPTLHLEDVPLHTHESASLVFVLDGAYLTSADGLAKFSSAPIVIYNPEGTTHRDSFVVPEGRFMALSLSAEVTRIVHQGTGLPTVSTAFHNGDPLRAAQRLVRGCFTCQAPDGLLLEDRCWELLAAISGTQLWNARPEKFAPRWLRQAREFLNECGGAGPSITDIARQLDLHPIYFARSFRKHFHCSPAEYRKRCRLQRAMELLLQSDQSLSDIALNAGFFDQSHFTTAFRRHFGHAPGRFRKRSQIVDSG